MTSIDQKKSGNYNEHGRTLHKSVFVEILAQTLNHDALIVGTIESDIKSEPLIAWHIIRFH
ncbi:hypothetical protein T11_16245 [Trichinella zimbabwensis]|uniref:Uncharacterized protein n=1 Tax=Trichinella zimbabwensis TaxID=268475 RepID=A0A0V1H160_9BILA|nr:hypothetical protein T11_16245 [Trichinella zimbabwensis]